jgi:hypothetical protein
MTSPGEHWAWATDMQIAQGIVKLTKYRIGFITGFPLVEIGG